MIEGTIARLPANEKRKHPRGEINEIDTRNILFICGGAFVGLRDVITNRVNGTTIGFQADIRDTKIEGELSQVTPDDLTKYGMIPEFIGRFTTTVSIKELDKKQLVKVLTEVKNNYVDQYKYLLKLDDIDLTFTKTALEQIAENTLELKTGARGLHTEIERTLMPHMFNSTVYREKEVKTLNIDRKDVLKPKALI
jgi:ATP-dependent Clp protease ATP-binding subunit ClpX